MLLDIKVLWTDLMDRFTSPPEYMKQVKSPIYSYEDEVKWRQKKPPSPLQKREPLPAKL